MAVIYLITCKYPTRIKEVSLFYAQYLARLLCLTNAFSVNSPQHIGIFLKKEKRETLTKVLKPLIATLDISLNSTRSTEKLAKCSWSIPVGFSPDPSGVSDRKKAKTRHLDFEAKSSWCLFTWARQTFLFISGTTIMHMHVHVLRITGTSSHVVSVGGELAATSFHFPVFCGRSSSAAPLASLLSTGYKGYGNK